MNPASLLEAVAGAQAPSATVQAMQALLAALAEPVAAVAAVAETAPAMQADRTLPDANVVSLPGDAQTLAATAQQGRTTLGQLATEPAALRAANDTSPDPAARPAPLPDAAAQQARDPAQALAVPVLLAAAHSPHIVAPHRPPVPTRPPLFTRPGADDGDDDAPAPAPQATPEPEPAPVAETDREAQALRQRLQRSGQADALADLGRGRHVLLVQAQADGTARTWLLSGRGLHQFAAHWRPGAADGPVWRQWRVFRDGDPLFTRGLRSRSAGGSCLLLLGTRAVPAGNSGALLEIEERIRFAQALGGQWSLLLLAMPAATAAPV